MFHSVALCEKPCTGVPPVLEQIYSFRNRYGRAAHVKWKDQGGGS